MRPAAGANAVPRLMGIFIPHDRVPRIRSTTRKHAGALPGHRCPSDRNFVGATQAEKRVLFELLTGVAVLPVPIDQAPLTHKCVPSHLPGKKSAPSVERRKNVEHTMEPKIANAVCTRIARIVVRRATCLEQV